MKDGDFSIQDGGPSTHFSPHFLSQKYKSNGSVISPNENESGSMNQPEFDKFSKFDKISEL